MSNVAFIGLGVMGYPMAGYISKAGHNVTVYNRTAAKADKWIAEYKGSKADTPAKACLLYTSPSPRDTEVSRMPSSA